MGVSRPRLLSRKVRGPRLKLFGRWRSDAAVKLYARLTPDAYARHISASLRADAAHLTAEAGARGAMDNVDPRAFIRETEGIADAGDGTAPQAHKKHRLIRPRRSPPAPPRWRPRRCRR